MKKEGKRALHGVCLPAAPGYLGKQLITACCLEKIVGGKRQIDGVGLNTVNLTQIGANGS